MLTLIIFPSYNFLLKPPTKKTKFNSNFVTIAVWNVYFSNQHNNNINSLESRSKKKQKQEQP